MSLPGVRPLGGGTPWPTVAAGRTEDRREDRRRGSDTPPRTWAEALDDLEDDTRSAERTLAGASPDEIAAWGRRSTDWVPPSGLGPLPDDLRERAARLLQHQLAVAEALVEGITQSRRQRDLAARMSQSPSRPVSSFIDRPV
ncbi:hypothetical protein [Klenkia sp. PcliD-1-E]|uniref:hypothetical protein n=1 Tax=Klenkia sp. PcliD-1-E TaxID=2954492 RepID=UPI002097FCC2|nr:hypothetical protein [Klenkia sp. PcliD-1-E]MCO7221999.1 hypothetical protein [Klenkia sp. PcliD-1-E]